MAWKGFRYTVPTIEIDLTNSVENLLNNLDKDARWGLNKAKKEGLVAKEADEQEAKEFYKIYLEMCSNNSIESRSFEDISQAKEEGYIRKIFVCKKDRIIASGAAITIDKKRNVISLYINASNHEFLKLQPNNLIYWTIIEYGKKINAGGFDLGGYEPNAKKGSKLYEINRFKERWGGKIVKYPVYSKNPFYILGKKIKQMLKIP
jgi:lipid II:glycine glycyltransferase (peptidoglycan interpeptide bridge formation enzyme)